MADSNTEIDLDSVIDRLLEGELACCTSVIMVAMDTIGAGMCDIGIDGASAFAGNGPSPPGRCLTR